VCKSGQHNLFSFLSSINELLLVTFVGLLVGWSVGGGSGSVDNFCSVPASASAGMS
jgi:hypothetical protein